MEFFLCHRLYSFQPGQNTCCRHRLQLEYLLTLRKQLYLRDLKMVLDPISQASLFRLICFGTLKVDPLHGLHKYLNAGLPVPSLQIDIIEMLLVL